MAGSILKRIGFLFCCVLLLFCVELSARTSRGRNQEPITMKLFSLHGEPLHQAVVGRPFTIKVMIADDKGRVGEPKIMGVTAQRTGIHIQTINGASTTTYTYRAVVDQPGEYDIGPAIIQMNGDQIESDRIRITVSDQEKTDSTQTKKGASQQKQLFAELFVDTDDVVVKEAVRITLRCYYQNGVKLQSISKPNVPWLQIGELQGPYEGTEYVGTQLYQYAEWQWYAYPQEAGSFVIPAFGVHGEIDARTHQSGMFSHMPLFFVGFANEQVQAYTEGVSITVSPLPKDSGRLDAVGQFRNFSASLEPATVKEGEAMVLALELEGTDGLDMVSYTNLEHMPEEVRWYYSKTVVEDGSTLGSKKKRWEFVVQAMKEGEIEIPAQQFRYFDTAIRRYILLTSLPIHAKIIPNPGIITELHTPAFAIKKNQEIDTNTGKKQVNLWVDSWAPVPSREPLPLSYMFFICVIPFLCLSYKSAKEKIASAPFLQTPWFVRKKIFYSARRKISRAAVTKNTAAVYYVFDVLLQQILALRKIELLSFGSDMELLSQQMFFKDEKIRQEWLTFIARASRYAFDKKEQLHYDDLFFKQAYVWLDYFRQENI